MSAEATRSAVEPAAVVEARATDELAKAFHGEVVRPSDATYEEHRRVWNGSIDKRPALIARCADAVDVSAAVRFARAHDLLVAVRGGGHSFPGLSVCNGGIVIDLSLMKAISVDPEARTARVQGGALLGEMDQATQEFGMAVPAGIVTHTGVAGLTLGGGLGWIMRKFGLTIDQLLSVDVVTADGDFVKASRTENTDLFWGVRGGGGNFGVVTEFEFRLNPLGPIVMSGPIFWPMSQSPRVLRFYRDWIAEAPDELMTIVVHRKAPAWSTIPTELHGQPIVGVVCCYAGPVDDGERVVRPMRTFGSPVLDLCQPKPYVEHQAMFDPSFVRGWWYYVRSCDVAELNDDVIDITAEHASRLQSPLTTFPIWQLGGATQRVAEEDTAFGQRQGGHTFNINAVSADETRFEEERQWARDFWQALSPHHTSVYTNFLMEEGEARVRQAYGPATYDRLQRLKQKYDPENVFRLNQNIAPA